MVRFKIEGNRLVGIKDAVNLKEALLKADSVQQAITAKTGAAVDFNELNIEGLAYDSQQSRLLIGLREPMAGKLSIIIAINNPQALFDQQAAPQFGEVTLLDLGGGIRSLDYVAETNSYLIANEKENEQGKNRSRLWRWDGKPQSAAQPLAPQTGRIDLGVKARGNVDDQPARDPEGQCTLLLGEPPRGRRGKIVRQLAQARRQCRRRRIDAGRGDGFTHAHPPITAWR